jgi:hypothetical protein
VPSGSMPSTGTRVSSLLAMACGLLGIGILVKLRSSSR